MDLNALLGGGMPDPVAFGERIFKQLQDRLVSDGTLADVSDKQPEELIATVVGDWLTRVIGNTDSSVLPGGPTSGDRDRERLYKKLRDRNIALAAALGACGNCWGTCVDCLICGGAGVPGWVLPDEQLYASYVHPAVCAVTTHHGSVPALGVGGTN